MKKIELIRTEEMDGNWIKLMVNGKNIECRRLYGNNDDNGRMEEMISKYHRAVRLDGEEKTEIILTNQQ